MVKWIVKVEVSPRSRCLTKLDNCAGKRKKTDERQGCEVELTRGRRKKEKEKTSKTESCRWWKSH